MKCRNVGKILLTVFMILIFVSSLSYCEGNAESTQAEIKIVKILTNPYVSTILLTLGFIGMMIEIFTPGFGIGGIISIISFGLFFGGNMMAGNTEWTSIILFVAGMILLIVEGMVPGFGLPGISGIILVVIGLVLAMNSLQNALMAVSISIIITAIITVILVKYGHKKPYFDKIVLSTEQKNQEGYTSANSKIEYLGKEGIAITELRPSGIIEVEGKRMDALSEGNYISKGSKIKIGKVEGSKIIVRRLENDR